jgi:hypothetical protein
MTLDTGGDLEGAVRDEWPEGIGARIDTVGLAADSSACARDDGAFVTSLPTRCPMEREGSLPRPCRCSLKPTRSLGSRKAPPPGS